jgi:hypothetical protein
MLRIPHCLDSRLSDVYEAVSLMHGRFALPSNSSLFLSLVLISIRG